jgi:dsDNA-specific endonuclease/ATPase MutS2
MPTGKLTKPIIEAAIAGFEAQKQRIDAQIAELRAMLIGAPEESAKEAPAEQKRRKFSAAARKRMREAQKLRWARLRGESRTAPEAKPAKKTVRPKPHFSAAARKALSDAMKKRWAAKRAASGQSAPAAKTVARKKAA